MTVKKKWIKAMAKKEGDTKEVAVEASKDTFKKPTVKGMMHKMFGSKE
jgi:hypothetical protein